MKCFPIEVQEIPVKNLSNLKYAKKKLQHFLVKELESLDYTNRLFLAKMNNPAFYQFLLDNTDSSASSFFSQIPQIYGLLLNNEEWETFIRLQCYLWPQQLVNGLKCKCDTPVSLTHLFNCQHLVTFRRCLHDNVYKDIYQMAKAFNIEIFPNRGDLIMPWFKSSQLIIDDTSPLTPLLPYFNNVYSLKSQLIFHSFSVLSASGVKQGDPLGPLLFCLALHSVLEKFKIAFPQLDIVGYMDDLTIIGPPEQLTEAFPFFAHLASEIGLSLNAKKCVLLHQQDTVPLKFNDVLIPSVDFRTDALRLLGAYIGFSEKVRSLLTSLLDGFEKELNMVTSFSIPKQLKFSFLRCCYSSKFNHIFRSSPPSISLQFAQRFNSLRTKFIANLINVEEHYIPSHAFFSFNLGGIGLTKSSIATKSAFLGGLRNFLFEFSLCFPEECLQTSVAPSLVEGRKLINSLDDSIWSRLFPNNSEVKEKSLSNLIFTYKKLQNKLKVIFETDAFSKKISMAKTENASLYNLLLEISSTNSTPSSSLLLSTIPRKFGLNLKDDRFVSCLKLRLNLDPGIFLTNSLCLCGKNATLNHVLCCPHLIWSRTLLHDAMINELHKTCKSVGVVSQREPLLSLLSSNMSKWSSKSRGDLHLNWLKSKQLIIDATTVFLRVNRI
ncbi:hypothetical protein RCL1_008600 [Eukaryota sp. TZLM3-RCL]